MTRKEAIDHINNEVIKLRALAEHHNVNVALFNESNDEGMWSHVCCHNDFLTQVFVDTAIREPDIFMDASKTLVKMGPKGMRARVADRKDLDMNNDFTTTTTDL